MGPSSSSTRSAAVKTRAWSATSTGMSRALPPPARTSRAAPAKPFSPRASSATRAPRAPYAVATARPIPPLAPVITTTCAAIDVPFDRPERPVSGPVGIHLSVPPLAGGEPARDRQFGDFGSDQVRAEQLAVGVVAQELHEAGWITQTLCFAVRRERECGDLDVVTEFPCLGFRVAETGDLWLAARRPRDHRVVQRHRFHAGDRLRSDDAHGLGCVGEHELGRDVADREDVRDVAAAELIDHDGTAVGQFHPGVQPVARATWGETDCLLDDVGFENPLIGARGDGDLTVSTVSSMVSTRVGVST